MLFSKKKIIFTLHSVQSNTYQGRGSLTAGANVPSTGILGNGPSTGGTSGTANLIMQTSYTKQ